MPIGSKFPLELHAEHLWVCLSKFIYLCDIVQGSCGCGITNSCESKTVKCNCQIGDGKARKDIGLIIDKNDLPILKVTSTVSDGIFVLGPLECSQKQFGKMENSISGSCMVFQKNPIIFQTVRRVIFP